MKHLHATSRSMPARAQVCRDCLTVKRLFKTEEVAVEICITKGRCD